MTTVKKIYLKIGYAETFYEEFKELEVFPCKIGRDPSNTITLMGQDISRFHAEIFEKEGKFYIKDLQSTSGLRYRGKVVEEAEVLEGAHFRVGLAQLHFSFVAFPLEQTNSSDHYEDLSYHEPLLKKLEAKLDGRLIPYLFAALALVAFFSTPNHIRKSDLIKSMISSVLGVSLLVPFLMSIFVVVIRKINRGEYSWGRSLTMVYVLCLAGQLVSFFEKSFCWYESFDLLWNSVVWSIIAMAVFFFWWFLAVGRDVSLKARFFKGLGLSVTLYVLSLGFQMLSTGYHSEFEIESCDSVTGWHWGAGKDLSSLESFLDNSAKTLGL